MKPPKSIRNIVNTLLGKKSKSLAKASETFDDSLSPIGLDKIERHHRSADDLLDETSYERNTNRLPHVSSNARSRSLPRRSQSSLCIRAPISRQSEPIYGRRVVNGLDNEASFGNARTRSVNSNPRFSDDLARTVSNHSNATGSTRTSLSRRINPRTVSQFDDRDEGFEDCLPRTTSWSHPQYGSERSRSFNFSDDAQNYGTEHGRRRTESIGSTSRTLSGNFNNLEKNRTRFSSHENLLGDSHSIPRLGSSASSRGTLTSNSKDATQDKLRTCLQVLDRLSAQVKEIKDVSKRVNYVDNKVKNGHMQRSERQRRMRELDMAETASRRLKNILKSEANDIPSTRLSSRSSGYESENSISSRLSSSSPEQEAYRFSRPESRLPSSTHGSNLDFHHLPYPQSLSDMMPLWDAKDQTTRSYEYGNKRMTREDSMSSGYATGSGSEDGKQESDTMPSGYSTHINNQHSMTAQQWHQYQQRPSYGSYSQHPSYDPYAVYGTYPHHPVGNVQATQEDIYGTYGELYGYAPSSVYDQEIYNNGWFQLPSANQSNAAKVYDNNQATSAAMPAANTFDQTWPQISYAAQPISAKYGGLSHIFYDPTAQSEASIMESIAKEVSQSSPSSQSEDNTWKSYGSFRYRNGQMTVTSSNRKRKTVRFSQTVRQRVETEESEMEDSTSVIKGGADETPTNDTKIVDETTDSVQDSEIYMWPKQPALPVKQISQNQEGVSNSQQKAIHEPIYEFPSGHIESSCMCSDCILARSSCQMQPAQAVAYF